MDKKKLVIEYKDISQLKEWDRNPRGITNEGFERLKKQILKFGLYKPFLINEEGIVLGGNMRFKACKALNIAKVPVSVVVAKTDKEKLEYALSDNDRAGYYEDSSLAEIVYEFKDEITLDEYNVDLGKSIGLNVLLESISDIGNQTTQQKDPASYDGFVVVLKIPSEKFEQVKKEIDILCKKYVLKADIS